MKQIKEHIGIILFILLFALLLLSATLNYLLMSVDHHGAVPIQSSSAPASDQQSSPLPTRVIQPSILLPIHPSATVVDPAVALKNIIQIASHNNFAGLSVGHGPVHLVIFFDPNCIFCHQTWVNLHKIPNYKDKFTIIWVPVAFLKISSISKSEAILAHGHAPMLKSRLIQNDFSGGGPALSMNELNFNMLNESGAIAPFDNESLRKIIVNNSKAWLEMDGKLNIRKATPLIIINDHWSMVGSPTAELLDQWAHGAH